MSSAKHCELGEGKCELCVTEKAIVALAVIQIGCYQLVICYTVPSSPTIVAAGLLMPRNFLFIFSLVRQSVAQVACKLFTHFSAGNFCPLLFRILMLLLLLLHNCRCLLFVLSSLRFWGMQLLRQFPTSVVSTHVAILHTCLYHTSYNSTLRAHGWSVQIHMVTAHEEVSAHSVYFTIVSTVYFAQLYGAFLLRQWLFFYTNICTYVCIQVHKNLCVRSSGTLAVVHWCGTWMLPATFVIIFLLFAILTLLLLLFWLFV